MNQVDILLKQVEDIRKTCSHQFKALDPSIIPDSLVPGLLEGLNLTNPKRARFSFHLKCTKCSMVETESALVTCPLCFRGLVKDEGLDSDRAKYFGQLHLYYSVRISRCPEGHFSIASDEWDQ